MCDLMRKMPNKMKKALKCVAIFILLVCYGVYCWNSGASASLAVSEITCLFRTVNLGMTQAEFDEFFDSANYQTLKVVKVSHDSILVRTPLVWGAANWVLWLDFSDSKLSKARIRIQDDESVKPEKAPPDKKLSDSSSFRAIP